MATFWEKISRLIRTDIREDAVTLLLLNNCEQVAILDHQGSPL